MEEIDINKNFTKTECGHCFHSSCLMKSVSYNGFGCPYCRTLMAEEVADEETVYEDENVGENSVIYDDDDDNSIGYEERFGEYELRGFRFFWNMANNEENDECDLANEENEANWVDASNATVTEAYVPSMQYVTDKLRDEGITYEQLVKIMLYRDHDEFDNEEHSMLDHLDGYVFGKIRKILTNYHRQTQTQQTQTQQTQNA